MYKREKLGLIFLLAFFTFFFLATKTVNAQARMYPYIVCTLGIALTALQLGMILAKEKRGEKLDGDAPLNKTQLYYLAVAIVTSVLYVFFASILGFFTVTFLYVALFSYWHTRTQKKWMYAAVALGMDVVIYITFKILLSIPLPTGLLI